MAKPPESVVSKVRKLMQAPGHRGALTREDAKQAKVPLDEFVALLYECNGSAYKVSQRLGMSHRAAAKRRTMIEESLGIVLPKGRPEIWMEQAHRQHIDIRIDDGVVLVGSDLHAWPEINGTAMAAFVDFHRLLKPGLTILNGDGFDGAQISRHPRIGWDKRPTVAEEIEALSEYLDAVVKANPNGKRIRTRGNHDSRFDTFFASRVPEAEGVRGTALADHLPGWDECMSITINGNCVVQHRYRGGVHAPWNNVRDYGCHSVTGHRHQGEAKPWTNELGTWWGVDAGMLAPVWHPAFDYMERRKPHNWRSSFAVLTFMGGALMPPEIAFVTDEDAGELYFRGKTLKYEL